ncbi:MAG: hypothetical protein CVU77_04760 [Elusimicrobia bacterium HGW-Elusimicrobia-1]|jgi:hypothetical protein|nr:MAG: hypothetical protein CVU77_04760 [Elusimicrobia bacterium HGW-Elusimicrobia-1]
MLIVKDTISRDELKKIAAKLFGDMVKAVIDIDRGLIAVDAELHSDLEAVLIEDGSHTTALWGINLYPELSGEDYLEFDSLINVKPSVANRTRGVEDEKLRERIKNIVAKRITV